MKLIWGFKWGFQVRMRKHLVCNLLGFSGCQRQVPMKKTKSFGCRSRNFRYVLTKVKIVRNSDSNWTDSNIWLWKVELCIICLMGRCRVTCIVTFGYVKFHLPICLPDCQLFYIFLQNCTILKGNNISV